MDLKPVPLFGLGNVGRSVNVSAQTRVNLYPQIEKDQEKNVVTMYPTPGLLTFVSFGASPCRALYARDNTLYAVNGNQLFSVAADGTITARGTLLTGSGRCDMVDNGTQLMIVDGTNGYIFNFNTLVFTQITSPNWPGASTVTFLNGVFIVNKPNTGQFYVSAQYDGLTWAALDFATAETDPDNLVRVLVDGGQLNLFGVNTTEFWGDSGARDFPLARIGAAGVEWGLAARWSLCKFEGSLMFLRRNRLGQVQVCQLSGYNIAVKSNPELETTFQKYTSVENATAFSYMMAGHAFYQINFPTANESWLFDGQTESWSKVQSGNGRHRGEIQVNFLSKPYVSDYDNGKVYRLDMDTYTDDGEYIVREFTSRHQSTGDFSRFAQMWLEMESGVGLVSGQGSDPKITMQVSRDGGHTYGPPVESSLGKIGEYRTRAIWNRIGRSRDWLYRFRVTDSVKTVFVAAWGKYGI